MSFYINRPQCMGKTELNFGSEFSRPFKIFPCRQDPTPGVDTELVEEVEGIFDALLYDQGDDAGFVLVQEL